MRNANARNDLKGKAKLKLKKKLRKRIDGIQGSVAHVGLGGPAGVWGTYRLVHIGHDPFSQNFRRFRTKWIGSVQPRKEGGVSKQKLG